MPPRKKNDEKLPQLTPNEGKFFYAMAKHAKGTPSVDWDAAASDLELKDSVVARARFGQIMKKYRTSKTAPSASAGPSNAPKGVKKSSGRVGSKGRTSKSKGKAKAQDTLSETEKEEADDKEGNVEADEENKETSPVPMPGHKK